MKKLILGIIICCILSLLSACSNQIEASPGEPLLIELENDLSNIKPDKETELVFNAQLGDEQLSKKVDQAKIEIWTDNDQKPDILETKNNKEKITATYKFANDSTYYIKYRFTADGKVYEETKSFTVNKEEHAVSNEEETDSQHNHQHTEDSHSAEENNDEIQAHLVKQDSENDKTSKLIVHLTKNNETLEDAAVRFELKDLDGGNSVYIETTEENKGEYIGDNIELNQSKSNTVIVHIEKGDIHLHKEIKLIN